MVLGKHKFIGTKYKKNYPVFYHLIYLKYSRVYHHLDG